MDDDSSHSSETGSDTSDLEDVEVDFGNLQPYDFEPETSVEMAVEVWVAVEVGWQ